MKSKLLPAVSATTAVLSRWIYSIGGWDEQALIGHFRDGKTATITGGQALRRNKANIVATEVASSFVPIHCTALDVECIIIQNVSREWIDRNNYRPESLQQIRRSNPVSGVALLCCFSNFKHVKSRESEAAWTLLFHKTCALWGSPDPLL